MWQYEKCHGLRYVLDYVRGNAVFAVHFLSHEKIEGFIFDMPPQTQFNLGDYAITMSEFNGLSRRAFDKFQMPHALDYFWDKVGKGSFEDFEKFAKYAVNRLPILTKEIFLDGVDVIDDVPDNELIFRGACSRDMRTINWTHFDREMFRDFYRSFTGTVKQRRKILSRERFSKVQADGLLQIVSPLAERC